LHSIPTCRFNLGAQLMTPQPLRGSIIPSYGQVHPQKIDQTCLRCSFISPLDLTTYGSSHHHDNHPSSSILITQSLQQRIFPNIIPLQPRGNPNEGLPCTSSDVPISQVQPPEPYGRSPQEPVHKVAYLDARMCLIQGQTVSGLAIPARP